MCPRKRGLFKQEGRDGGCKGFGGTARHELQEYGNEAAGSAPIRSDGSFGRRRASINSVRAGPRTRNKVPTFVRVRPSPNPRKMFRSLLADPQPTTQRWHPQL